MNSAIEWVRALQTEGWVVGTVEVDATVGAALVEAQLVTSGQLLPERMPGRIHLTSVDGVTFDAVLSQ
jgi:hypothetical protein